jgi:hypothetical protein
MKAVVAFSFFGTHRELGRQFVHCKVVHVHYLVPQ